MTESSQMFTGGVGNTKPHPEIQQELKKKNYSSRNWCFTIFESKGERRPFEIMEEMPKSILYYIYQTEKCPTSGKLHYQGYIHFKRCMALENVKRIHKTGHWAICQGNAQQNIIYCSKIESRIAGPFTWGDIPTNEKGKRNDLIDLKDKIKEGATYKEIVDDDTFTNSAIRYERATKGLIELFDTQVRNWKMEVICIFGEAGCGKTRKTMELIGNDTYYKKMPNNTWWDGYDGQHTVILDDFNGSWFHRDYFLNLLDRYSMMVEIKGGTKNFKSRRIIITSNTEPKNWYKPTQYDQKNIAILRRFTRIVHLKKKKEEPIILCEIESDDDEDNIPKDAIILYNAPASTHEDFFEKWNQSE